ncbi:MAG TPA: cob(I)yrinic acid a,c-diamide adenosyltransferase [Euzebyales bacterium]
MTTSEPTPDRDPTVPPTDTPPRAERSWAPSLLLVNTGDGKGKTTAALGTLLRARARGWPVCVVQFMKSGDWKVGEEQSARALGIDWWTIGDGFTWESDDLDRSQAVAVEAWRQAREIIGSSAYRVVMLDEITYPINFGWIDLDEVVSVLRDRPDGTTVIVTGRDAPQAIIDIADTVTEMRKIKHAFDRGIQARRGIDY